jgi:hypothetical protein
MQPIQIKPIEKNITIRFAGKTVALPEAIEAKITEHWQQLTQANPRLRNGEVFTVTGVEDAADGMVVQLAETNYAHYLYSHQVGDLGEYTVRIIHSSALVISSDNKLIFGAMAGHTSRPGVIQCVGGGIDHKNIHGGIVDIEHNTANELKEELGIDPHDTSLVESFSATYLKFGGPTGKMTVVYIVRIKQAGAEFLKAYEAFAKELAEKDEEPEFDKIFTLAMDKPTVDTFIAEHTDKLDEYMTILIQTIASQGK